MKASDPAGHSQATKFFWCSPIAKVNVIVPHYFAAQSDAPLSSKFKRYTREQIILLRDAGLVECVNAVRKLWRLKHVATAKTDDAKQRSGGLLSLGISLSLQGVMAGEMDRGDV